MGREGNSFSVLRTVGLGDGARRLTVVDEPPTDHGVLVMDTFLAGDCGRDDGGVTWRVATGVDAAALATLSQTLALLVFVLVPPRLVFPLLITRTRFAGLLAFVLCAAPMGDKEGKFSSYRYSGISTWKNRFFTNMSRDWTYRSPFVTPKSNDLSFLRRVVQKLFNSSYYSSSLVHI